MALHNGRWPCHFAGLQENTLNFKTLQNGRADLQFGCQMAGLIDDSIVSGLIHVYILIFIIILLLCIYPFLS